MSLTPQDLLTAYQRGENICALLRDRAGTSQNSEEMIQLSYDLQAGSYVDLLEKTPAYQAGLASHTRGVARYLAACGPLHSLLEAGTGETTTLQGVVASLPAVPAVIHGVDISWSRLKVGSRWFRARGGPAHTVFSTASMTHLPFADNSFDVVFTNHAIEPNGGREEELLAELHRVASRYLVVCEPAYELTTPEIRRRMDSHGYCRDLPGHARRMGLSVVKHEALAGCMHATNPTAVTVIAKDPSRDPASPVVVCPAWRTPMELLDGFYFSPGSMRAYPVLQGIPCLKKEHGIIAGRFLD